MSAGNVGKKTLTHILNRSISSSSIVVDTSMDGDAIASVHCRSLFEMACSLGGSGVNFQRTVGNFFFVWEIAAVPWGLNDCTRSLGKSCG